VVERRGGRRTVWLATYAGGVLAFMVLVILEGALVRATGSGAGCGNHWPLCNGEVIPHHPRLATVIEFLHRSLTGVLTTMCAVLIAWVFTVRPAGDRVRRAAVWVGVLLVTEALLGAVLVKGGYVERNASNMRLVVQGVHFTNTMLLVAALTLVWWWLGVRETLRSVDATTRKAAWTALAATMVVGATGSVAALADTLFPAPSLRAGLREDFSAAAPLLVRMRWVHPAAALVAVACVGWLCWRVRGAVARWVVELLLLQMVLGVVDVWLLAPTWIQVMHLLGADCFWIALVGLAADVLGHRNVDSLRG
jgi:cytochrome c oxidase assembly protein subunit 15